MTAMKFTSAVLVSLLLGIATPALADRDQRDHPRKQRGHSRRVEQQRSSRHHVWQQHRARSWQSDHRTWEQRGGYRGYRIPDTRFRRSFGPQHSFRIHRLPYRVVGGAPRFQYNGYWMSMVDPWPEHWDENWYENDDVYVNYVDNGYYLFNRRDPDFRISLSISR